MSNLRFKALESIEERKAIEPKKHHDKISDIFGANVFSLHVMKEYLDADIFEQIRSHSQHGETLDRNIADKVAHAMKAWASEKGATI